MFGIITFIAAIAVGFIALSLSADRLIEVASTLAARLGMSTLIIGMTIVAFGTSAPELLVSFIASYSNTPGIAVGNALGSNIINTGLVLGICGIIYPLTISHRVLTRELPLLCLISVFTLVLMLDGFLNQTDGMMLATGLLAYCYYLTRHSDTNNADNTEVVILPITTFRAATESLILLMVLLGSSKLLVWGATELARSFGISDVIIGLTVIAFGTSLPELAAGLASARKGMFDMLLAMIIGSNIFNLLGVLAFPGIVGNGIELDIAIVHRDGFAMLILTLVLAFCALTSMKHHKPVYSAEGAVLSRRSFVCNVPGYKSWFLLMSLAGYFGLLIFSITA